LVYSKLERVTDVNEINHPSIREAMKWFNMVNLRIVYEADLPARSGLGTSSSFAVGLLNGFYALQGKRVDKHQLAKDAIHLERVLCSERGGIQDQIAVSCGGLNRISFDREDFYVDPIVMSIERKRLLKCSLMLFFTGFSRFSSDIQVAHQKNLEDKKNQLLEIKSLVKDAETILTGSGDLNEFGKLLDYAWKLKRSISDRISTNCIDYIYSTAIKAGAIGGKLLGAGGGGFFVFFVEHDKQKAVRKALAKFMEVPFDFENGGTRVLYFTPEAYLKNNN